MKKLFWISLLLCLGLAGCTAAGASQTVTAPTKTAAATLPVFAAEQGGSDARPTLVHTGKGSWRVRGPAAEVEARTFLGAVCSDPLYADLDEDGQTELIYRCPGPTSGLWTEALCVYGLEDGWPVLKACSIYNLLNSRDVGLEQEGGGVFFQCTVQEWDAAKKEWRDRQTQRLPVTVRGGSVLLNGAELPENLQDWGGTAFRLYGSSLLALKRQVGDGALFDHWNCLIWQRSEIRVTEQAPDGEEVTTTLAAVSDNGVTVTGVLSWEDGALGRHEGLEPIPPVADPAALNGLTEEALDERFGPCHFDMGSGLYLPCWFTEDGKLLTVRPFAESAELLDVCAGTPLFAQTGPAGEPDPAGETALAAKDGTVSADYRTVPTKVANLGLWQDFTQTAARGEPCQIVLHLVYGDGTFDLPLSYDGTVYRLTDEGTEFTFRYLVVSTETDPPAGARFRQATHWLLSDDAEMTQERYFSHMVSSTFQPDFPSTRSIFTIFE